MSATGHLLRKVTGKSTFQNGKDEGVRQFYEVLGQICVRVCVCVRVYFCFSFLCHISMSRVFLYVFVCVSSVFECTCVEVVKMM